MIEEWLRSNLRAGQISAVAYRVVHGGSRYHQPVAITEDILDYLSSLKTLAPLHQPISIAAIRHFMAVYPTVKHWACFDTAFHSTMPKVAQTFAIPKFMRQQGIKPYGFHGLSYQSIVNQFHAVFTDDIPQRVVVAHLGSGSSVCALQNGTSIATTMTFSPLDGLPMATRSGRLDPSAVIYMIDELKLSPAEVARVLNEESGLAGLSGLTGDIRELVKSTDKDARFAVDYYVYSVVQALGAMIAVLKGLDALIFTGGIGANSACIRQQICERCQWLGLELNVNANREQAIKISSDSSQIDVFSLKANEELAMATWVTAVSKKGESYDNDQ